MPRDTKERGEPSPRGFRERDDGGCDAEEDDAEREREAKAREEALLKEQEKAESHSLPRGAYAPFDVDAT